MPLRFTCKPNGFVGQEINGFRMMGNNDGLGQLCTAAILQGDEPWLQLREHKVVVRFIQEKSTVDAITIGCEGQHIQNNQRTLTIRQPIETVGPQCGGLVCRCELGEKFPMVPAALRQMQSGKTGMDFP